MVIDSCPLQMLKAAIKKLNAKLILKLGSSRTKCLISTLSEPTLTIEVHGTLIIPRLCRNY